MTGVAIGVAVYAALVGALLVFVADGWGSDPVLRRVRVARRLVLAGSAVALIYVVVLIATRGFPVI